MHLQRLVTVLVCSIHLKSQLYHALQHFFTAFLNTLLPFSLAQALVEDVRLRGHRARGVRTFRAAVSLGNPGDGPVGGF